MPDTEKQLQQHLTRHWHDRRKRSWTHGYKNYKPLIEELRDHRKFNRFWGHTTLATLNVRSLGQLRRDSDYHYSYIKGLNHDATGLTEMWNTHTRYESWTCVTSAPCGDDKPSGVCIILSERFASRQLNRGRIGSRGCWIRVQGPVCNLLLMCVYLPPLYTKAAEFVAVMKGIREVLADRSLHDCVILFGDFNVKFPRRYQNMHHRHVCMQTGVTHNSASHSGFTGLVCALRPMRA